MIPYKEIIGPITDIEPFAINTSIDVLDDLRTRTAEVHWYEANGIGRREIKIKRFLK